MLLAILSITDAFPSIPNPTSLFKYIPPPYALSLACEATSLSLMIAFPDINISASTAITPPPYELPVSFVTVAVFTITDTSSHKLRVEPSYRATPPAAATPFSQSAITSLKPIVAFPLIVTVLSLAYIPPPIA